MKSLVRGREERRVSGMYMKVERGHTCARRIKLDKDVIVNAGGSRVGKKSNESSKKCHDIKEVVACGYDTICICLKPTLW